MRNLLNFCSRRFVSLCACSAAFFAGAVVTCRPVFSEDAQSSTETARPSREANPLMLTLAKDNRDSRVSLDYSVRWDFSDLSGFRPGFKTLSDSISAIRDWDITENTRVKYYGFRANPWRIFIAREKVEGAAPSGVVGGSSLAASGVNSPAYRKRLRLSLSPLLDDFKRDLDENLRNVLLQNSLKAAGPQWQNTSTRNKKAFFQDVLSLGIWELPGLDTTKEGLEYISK
jgi:hypothetical protein